MNISFEIDNINLDLQDVSPVLICGYTGSGKSFLLQNIFKQIAKRYPSDIGFLIIDLKMVEWKNVTDPNQIEPTVTDVLKVDSVLDKLLTNDYKKPIIVFWDTYDDYILQNTKNF